MRRSQPLALIGALLLARSLAAQHMAGAELPPPVIELRGVLTVPMRIIDGRATVETMINGRGPFLLGIETGGPFTIALNARMATVLQIVPAAANGALYRLDSLRVGTLLVKDMTVGLAGAVNVPGVDGMIGIAFFRELLLTVDYPRRQVRLQRDTLPSANGRDILTVLRTGDGLVALNGDLAGRTGQLVIDTQGGGPQLSCGPSVSDSLPLTAPRVVSGQARIGFAGSTPVPTYAARLNGDVRIGRTLMQRPIFSVLPLPPALGCLLGIEFLKHVSMTLDQRTMRVRFTGDSVIAPSPSLRVTGMSITPDSSNTMRVVLVQAGSAAEQSGLLVGDEVVGFNGRAATFESTSPQVLRAVASNGQPMRLKVRRAGQLLEIVVTPRLTVQ